MIARYFTHDPTKWPDGMSTLIQSLKLKSDDTALVSLGLTFKYLESLLLAD